jgi:hypothetical protein
MPQHASDSAAHAPSIASPTLASVRAHGGRVFRLASALYYFWSGERQTSTAISLTRRLAMWRHGFLSVSARLYDFPRNDMRDYISDFTRRTKCRAIGDAHRAFFDHKVAQRAILQAQGVRQPETIAVLADGRALINPFSDTACNASGPELERLLIADGGPFIIKPEDGACGRGIFLVEVRGGALVRRRGRNVAPFRLADIGPQLAMVERRIVQGEFWRVLHAESVNTIRALTLWAPGEPAPFIARAVQRIGTADTVPTDNWSGGGICAPIDLATGQLGVGRMNPRKSMRPETHYARHPDSGARIEGAVLPGWEMVKRVVLRAAASMPINRYIGWDVAVDDTNTPLIVEGNSNSDLDLLQVHGGLLTDPAVRRFFEVMGVV